MQEILTLRTYGKLSVRLQPSVSPAYSPCAFSHRGRKHTTFVKSTFKMNLARGENAFFGQKQYPRHSEQKTRTKCDRTYNAPFPMLGIEVMSFKRTETCIAPHQSQQPQRTATSDSQLPTIDRCYVSRLKKNLLSVISSTFVANMYV